MNILNKKSAGFTLLEILIALFIFTIISMIMVSALHSILGTQKRAELNSKYFDALQTSTTLMSRDLEQAINRQFTDAAGVQQNAFIGSDKEIMFIHGGYANPQGILNHATLQRSHYFLQDNILIRETWPMLDITNDSNSHDRKLLEDVSSMHFLFLDDHGKFQSSWPPPGQTISTLPHAVRVVITLKNRGSLSQLYLLPGYQNAPAN